MAELISSVSVIVSAIVVAVGWAVASRNSNKHHLFEERLKKISEMLAAVLEAIQPIIEQLNGHPSPVNSEKMIELFSKARTQVQLYDLVDEVQNYETLVAAIE